MRCLDTSDCVDEFGRLSIEYHHKPICLGGKEKPMSVQVNGKMVEIALLQSRKWNALNEFEWGEVLCVKDNGNTE